MDEGRSAGGEDHVEFKENGGLLGSLWDNLTTEMIKRNPIARWAQTLETSQAWAQRYQVNKCIIASATCPWADTNKLLVFD